MIIALRVNKPTRRWHARLAEELAARGHVVHVETVSAPRRRWPIHDLVLRTERLIYGVSPSLFSVWPSPPAPEPKDKADVTIDLSGAAANGGHILRPVYDGAVGEDALLAILMQGRAPIISIRSGEHATAQVQVGRPATERPSVLAHALEQILVRLIGLLVDAVEKLNRDVPDTPAPSPSVIPPSSNPLRFLLRGISDALGRRFGAARGRPNHWRIAIRPLGGASVAESREWPAQSYATLLDDADHFYADPFPFEHGGRTFVFFESFPYRTKKGVIGVIEVADGRAVSASRTVLETPTHLSYPFVFEHGGEVYMLPEMSEARRVQLYRAVSFPDRWVPDRILIDDVVFGDATLIQHDGRFWMFGTIAGDGGSTWDQLAIFHAPDLYGPWTPHAQTPALVDASAARPAGAMWIEEGVLMRVAQDCRSGYGIGLAICRVDRLDTEGYAQTVVKRLGPPGGSTADGVHTLNRTASLEVIDLRIPHALRGKCEEASSGSGTSSMKRQVSWNTQLDRG